MLSSHDKVHNSINRDLSLHHTAGKSRLNKSTYNELHVKQKNIHLQSDEKKKAVKLAIDLAQQVKALQPSLTT